MPVKVILADDHLMVRQGLRALLERAGCEVVGEAGDGSQAVRLCQDLQPDVAVIDHSMPLLNGIDACREIGRLCKRTKTILLTMVPEDQHLLGAIQAGIKGFLAKTQPSSDLIQAINEVSRGAIYLSQSVSSALVRGYLSKNQGTIDPLTPRERQVLQLIAEGKTTKQLAKILGISFKTAESHRARTMQKLDLHETASLVRYAIRRGYVHP